MPSLLQSRNQGVAARECGGVCLRLRRSERVSSFGSRILGRQINAECAPLPGLAFDSHSAAMAVHYLRNNRESETDAGLLCCNERVENGFDLIGGNAATSVDHADFSFPSRHA